MTDLLDLDFEPVGIMPDDMSDFDAPIVHSPNGKRAPVSFVDTALEYAHEGDLCVMPAILPAKSTAEKWPDDIPDDDTIRQWFSQSNRAIGYLTGRRSGGAEMIDHESAATFDIWAAAVERNMPGLTKRLVIEKTMHGGRHAHYRCETIFDKNEKLARTPRNIPGHKPDKDGNTTLIETRSEGGFSVCYPSPDYSLLQGDLRDIPIISPAERDQLIECARMLDETTNATAQPSNTPERSAVYDILTRHDWTLAGRKDGVELWKRPGTDVHHSATWNYHEGHFHVFSTNGAPFDEGDYTLAEVQALLEPEAYAKRRYTLHTAQEALEPQPEIEWIIERQYSAPSVSMLAGEGGSGKTYAMLDAAACVARGERWIDFATRQSPVLIIDEESGKRRMYRRLSDVLRGHDAGPDTPIYFTTIEQFDLLSLADVLAIEAAIEETGARFIIVDALADVIPGGDENAVKDTQPVFRALRGIAERTNSAIVVIHHVNKAGQYRGSTAIKGAVDALIIVQKKTDDPHIVFEFDKARDVEPFKFAALANFAEGSFNLSPDMVSTSGKRERLTKAERYVIRFLKANDGKAALKDIGMRADSVAEGSAKNAARDLVEKGYTQRVDAGGQGQAAIYALTDKGLAYEE